VVRGGHAHNVIPGEVSVDLDCRLLPGFGPEGASPSDGRKAEATTGLAEFRTNGMTPLQRVNNLSGTNN
jgi:hypothetical protein